MVVHGVDGREREVAAAHAGLIGNDDEIEPDGREGREGGRRPREELELIRIGEEVAVGAERAVAIEEDSAAFHSSVSESV